LERKPGTGEAVTTGNSFVTMNETYHNQKKENRKFLVWFLIAVAVAVLPWLFLLD
jgi:hypothetical protein